MGLCDDWVVSHVCVCPDTISTTVYSVCYRSHPCLSGINSLSKLWIDPLVLERLPVCLCPQLQAYSTLIHHV